MADLQMKTIRYPGINNLYRFMQPDGTYPYLTAGNIISNDAYNEDTEPYLFRALPYKSKRLEEDLVGATVNWNQLVQNGNFADTSNWQILNATISVADNVMKIVRNDEGISSIYQVVNASANHKYLWTSEVKGDDAYTDWVMSFGSTELYTLPITTTWNKITKIINKTSTSVNFNAIRKNGGTSDDVVYIRNAGLIDLTAMFGSTIADYVYSLEQATAGSGIAWLKSYGFYTKPYYEYDAGTLKSVTPTAHVTRGVNAWDEEWEVGGINTTTGENNSSTDRIRSKNFIPVVAGATYFFNNGTNNLVCLQYDGDKNYTGTYSYMNPNQPHEIMGNNCHYIKFYMVGGYGTTYNNDICINISDPTINGKYFQYEEHTYPLGDVTLRGIPKLVNNELVYDGDIYEHDGSVTRKYGVVDLGTLTWATGGSGRHTSNLPTGIKKVQNYQVANMVCKYTTVMGNDASSIDKSIAMLNTSNLMINDSALNGTDAASFKTAMSGVYLVYELATPTTETTTPFEQYQVCETGGTEEYTTTNDVPVGHDTKYFKDVISSIAGIPEPPLGNGTYELKLTVTDGVASYSWVAV